MDFKKEDVERSAFVWRNAPNTSIYIDVINDLVLDKENPNCGRVFLKEGNKSKIMITIELDFLARYITQLAEDIVSYIGETEGWEESEDKFRKDIGLGFLSRYDRK